jgi:hypothetical protein
MEGQGGKQGYMLNKHCFLSLVELRDWVHGKETPSCGAYWDLFSIMVTMGPNQLMGKD